MPLTRFLSFLRSSEIPKTNGIFYHIGENEGDSIKQKGVILRTNQVKGLIALNKEQSA